MGDREILDTYLNSVFKNTSETDIFPHGPKSLLTSVIVHLNGERVQIFGNNLHKSKVLFRKKLRAV